MHVALLICINRVTMWSSVVVSLAFYVIFAALKAVARLGSAKSTTTIYADTFLNEVQNIAGKNEARREKKSN